MINHIPQPKIFGIPIDREVKMDNKNITIKDAINRLKQAMIEEPDYAYGWHNNIAMACYDAMPIAENNVLDRLDRKISNEAATRFMKMCFDVETSQGMLLKDKEK